MKYILVPFTLICSLLFLFSCSSRSSISPAQVNTLTERQEFTFMAERAHPTGMDVINSMYALRNGSAGRLLELDYGYSIVLKRGEMEVTLPYFGRMYVPSMDPDKNSYRFTSKKFSVMPEQKKKGSTVFTVAVEDQPHVQKVIIEVFNNGNAYVAIDSNDRQAISYDGYITANAVPKDKP